MKNHIIPILTVLNLCIAPTHAQPNETRANSFYFAPGLVLGSEIGLNGRIEFEKPNWGKLMYVSELALNDAIVFDNALGYGYPLLYGPNKALYANGYLSYMLLGGLGVNWQGPTAMFEIEYRYRWQVCFIGLGAFYRQMFLFNDNIENTLNRNKTHFAPSFGVRVNFGVYF